MQLQNRYGFAIMGWLQIQEFGKNQHPVRINCLYGIYKEEYFILYYNL